VNEFIATRANDRSVENLLCFSVNTDFYETLCLAFFRGPAHPASMCSLPALAASSGVFPSWRATM
jgi:hypothetical protein